MTFLTSEGRIDLRVEGSRDASKVARYELVVDRFLKTGEAFELREFEGDFVEVEGVEHFFLLFLFFFLSRFV